MLKVNKQKFKSLVTSTYISSDCSESVYIYKSKKISDKLLSYVPKVLFRYRSINEYTIEELKNDIISGSKLDTFNDPYESLPGFCDKKIEEYIVKNFNYKLLKQNIKYYNDRNLPSDLVSIVGENDAKTIINSLKSLDDNTIKNRSKEVLKEIQVIYKTYKEHILNNVLDIHLNVKNNKFISCLSERNDSMLMWSLYANSHKGFVIEYKFESCDFILCSQQCCEMYFNCPNYHMRRFLTPVIYNNSRFDSSYFVADYLLTNILMQQCNTGKFRNADIPYITKTLMFKSNIWKYEKEWRLIHEDNTSFDGKHFNIMKKRPSHIYLGAKITDEDYIKITSICDELDIAYSKMQLDYFTDEFKVKENKST